MIKETQTDRIVRKLKTDGEITSAWAVRHYILRLAARIGELQEAGWEFSKHFVEKNGRKTRVFQYVVKAMPKKRKREPARP